MGSAFSAIAAEEKVLRMSEERNELYVLIEDIEDIDSESGLKRLEFVTE